jgi:hypothetical protein
MQQRYIDPEIGAFLSVDPVTALHGAVANFNRHRYANSNPYRYVDPDGRKACGKDTTCELEQGAYGGTIQFAESPRARGSGMERADGSSVQLQESRRSDGQRAAQSREDVVDLPRIISVAYQGYYHDDLVRRLASDMASKGVNVLTEVPLCLGTACARIDIIGRDPTGNLFGIEVKTGQNPRFTPGQLAVYPHLRSGGILVSPDRKINGLGLATGVPFPSIEGVMLYQSSANSPPFYMPIP